MNSTVPARLAMSSNARPLLAEMGVDRVDAHMRLVEQDRTEAPGGADTASAKPASSSTPPSERPEHLPHHDLDHDQHGGHDDQEAAGEQDVSGDGAQPLERQGAGRCAARGHRHCALAVKPRALPTVSFQAVAQASPQRPARASAGWFRPPARQAAPCRRRRPRPASCWP